MKRAAFILLFILLLALAGPVRLEASLKLFIDDHEIELQQPLQMINGSFMIPLWVLQQHLGAEIATPATDGKIEMVFSDQTILMQLGQESAQVDGKVYKLDVAPLEMGGEILIPIRFIADRRNFSLYFVQEVMGLVLESPSGKIKEVLDIEQPGPREGAVVVHAPETDQSLREIIYQGGPRSRVFIDLKSYTGYQTSLLTNPDRLVIDLEGVHGEPLPVVSVDDDPILLQVRSSRFDEQTMRLVFDLKTTVGYKVSPWPDGGLEVEFNHRLTSVEISEEQGLPHLHFGLANPPEIDVVYLEEPLRLVLDLRDTTLAGGAIDTTVDFAAVQRLRVNQHLPSTTRVVLELKKPLTPLPVREQEGMFVIPLFPGSAREAEEYLAQLAVIPQKLPDEVENQESQALQPVKEGNLAGLIIAVDPGHGGSDPGTIGYQGTFEKDVTLEISKYLGQYLLEAGAQVVFTRDQDVYVSIFERPEIALKAGAHLFISIHVNSHLKRGTARGTETLYRARDPVSEKLARCIQQELVKAITLVDRRIWGRDDLAVFNGSNIPAVLVEVGFLDHPDEEVLLRAPGFQKIAAEGIFRGIERFYLENIK